MPKEQKEMSNGRRRREPETLTDRQTDRLHAEWEAAISLRDPRLIKQRHDFSLGVFLKLFLPGGGMLEGGKDVH